MVRIYIKKEHWILIAPFLCIFRIRRIVYWVLVSVLCLCKIPGDTGYVYFLWLKVSFYKKETKELTLAYLHFKSICYKNIYFKPRYGKIPNFVISIFFHIKTYNLPINIKSPKKLNRKKNFNHNKWALKCSLSETRTKLDKQNSFINLFCLRGVSLN